MPTAQRRAEEFLARHPTLQDLLQAKAEVLEVIAQDEFTHDVIARIPTAQGSLLAVFDST